MEKKNVLVTGIGGNVGQGIIKNIRAFSDQIKIIGTGISDFSSGNYLCDVTYKVPYAYEENYISAIIDIVKKEKVDLIIPSTDYEVYYLAANKSAIPCTLAASEALAAEIYLDKYKTFEYHKKYGIPFANAAEPAAYDGSFKECIVKPKKGRGSRGLHINPTNVKTFDSDYMVQDLIRGEEITTAFYVTKDRELLGHITLSRSLENGATSQCKVVTQFDEKLIPIMKKMIEHIPIAGSVNIQSIVTKEGNVVPFEVNCRISGTNSIRSNFGFKDVEYTIQEFLYGRKPSKPVITKGVAVRVLQDVIYPDQSDYEVLKNNSSHHFLF